MPPLTGRVRPDAADEFVLFVSRVRELITSEARQVRWFQVWTYGIGERSTPAHEFSATIHSFIVPPTSRAKSDSHGHLLSRIFVLQ